MRDVTPRTPLTGGAVLDAQALRHCLNSVPKCSHEAEYVTFGNMRQALFVTRFFVTDCVNSGGMKNVNLDGLKGRFRELVDQASVSQAEIAAFIGCEPNAFRQYCTGRTALPLRYWGPFCDYFKVSIEWLLTGKDNPILKAYYALDEDDRKIVDKFLFPHVDKVKKKNSA
jgi:hypothetical protein